MRKVLVLIVALVSMSNAFGQTKQGDSSVGMTVGYAFDLKHPVIGIDYRYNIMDDVRIAPSVSHYVKNNGYTAWMGEVNAHYVVKLNDQFGFYPLAGLSLSSWKQHAYKCTRLGANIGLGAEVYATKEISVGLEVKYNIMKDFSHPLAGVRVGYNF